MQKNRGGQPPPAHDFLNEFLPAGEAGGKNDDFPGGLGGGSAPPTKNLMVQQHQQGGYTSLYYYDITLIFQK